MKTSLSVQDDPNFVHMLLAFVVICTFAIKNNSRASTFCDVATLQGGTCAVIFFNVAKPAPTNSTHLGLEPQPLAHQAHAPTTREPHAVFSFWFEVI